MQATQQLPVGGVSNVVRSAAGFHVLKVLERQQAPATLVVTQTRARHILLRLSPQLTQAQALVDSGVIKGGMKVKLDAALETAAALRRPIIVAGWQQPEDLLKLMQQQEVGTCISW